LAIGQLQLNGSEVITTIGLNHRITLLANQACAVVVKKVNCLVLEINSGDFAYIPLTIAIFAAGIRYGAH
jgi:hypothetical protein